MATHSQLLNTTSGHFDELFVRVPPAERIRRCQRNGGGGRRPARENLYKTNTNSGTLAQHGQDIEGLKAQGVVLQGEAFWHARCLG